MASFKQGLLAGLCGGPSVCPLCEGQGHNKVCVHKRLSLSFSYCWVVSLASPSRPSPLHASLHSLSGPLLNASGCVACNGLLHFLPFLGVPWRLYIPHQQRRDSPGMMCIEDQGPCFCHHGEIVFFVPEGGNCAQTSDTDRWVDEATKASEVQGTASRIFPAHVPFVFLRFSF